VAAFRFTFRFDSCATDEYMEHIICFRYITFLAAVRARQRGNVGQPQGSLVNMLEIEGPDENCAEM
jgi:hypothetical protein